VVSFRLPARQAASRLRVGRGGGSAGAAGWLGLVRLPGLAGWLGFRCGPGWRINAGYHRCAETLGSYTTPNSPRSVNLRIVGAGGDAGGAIGAGVTEVAGGLGQRRRDAADGRRDAADGRRARPVAAGIPGGRGSGIREPAGIRDKPLRDT
jgi:hypothetical protein